MEKIPNANHEELPQIYDEEGRVMDPGIAEMMAQTEAPYHKGAGSHHATPGRIARGNLAAEDMIREEVRVNEMLERVENIGSVIEAQNKAKAEAEEEAQALADRKKELEAYEAVMAAFNSPE